MNAVLNNAKKIRNKLLYFIDTELRKNIKKNNILLIDSKTLIFFTLLLHIRHQITMEKFMSKIKILIE